MSLRMTLGELLSGETSVPPALAGLVLHGLRQDSRALRPGEAFVALRGARSHGLRHLEDARRSGAACVLFDPPAPDDIALPPEALPVPGLGERLGRLADRFFGAPSQALTMVGVTGTNGKTSTVQLLAQALEPSTFGPCGTIGTLGVGLRGELEAGERTTPDVVTVHATLADLRRRGATSVAMEVSSHALDQGRVDAVAFDVAVFTNLSRDHLDYHGDMARYGAAKALLLRWPSLTARVVNIDDAFVRAEHAAIAADGRCWTLSSRGDASARLRAGRIRLDGDGLAFDLCEGDQRAAVRSPLLGRFNVDNLLAVAGCLRALGFGLDATAERLQALRPVHGRMTRLGGGERPLAVVDYAHTPDALTQALESLRAHTRGRLLCVFGCGGERDRGKRPQMAQAAEQLADLVIVTDDNPRSEDGDAIVAEILAGFAAPQRVQVQRERASAIADALAAAGAGDVVLIAGKGHEPYQEVAGEKRPFDDIAVARALLDATTPGAAGGSA